MNVAKEWESGHWLIICDGLSLSVFVNLKDNLDMVVITSIWLYDKSEKTRDRWPEFFHIMRDIWNVLDASTVSLTQI